MIPDIKLVSRANVKIYGLVKASSIYDSSSPYGTDMPLPGFINVMTTNGAMAFDPGPTGGSEFHIKARFLRLGTNFEWPEISKNTSVTGKLEFDSQVTSPAHSIAMCRPFVLARPRSAWPTAASTTDSTSAPASLDSSVRTGHPSAVPPFRHSTKVPDLVLASARSMNAPLNSASVSACSRITTTEGCSRTRIHRGSTIQRRLLFGSFRFPQRSPRACAPSAPCALKVASSTWDFPYHDCSMRMPAAETQDGRSTLHYALDVANAQDVRKLGNQRQKNDLAAATLNFKLNSLVTFTMEESYYRTRVAGDPNGKLLPPCSWAPTRTRGTISAPRSALGLQSNGRKLVCLGSDGYLRPSG